MYLILKHVIRLNKECVVLIAVHGLTQKEISRGYEDFGDTIAVKHRRIIVELEMI